MTAKGLISDRTHSCFSFKQTDAVIKAEDALIAVELAETEACLFMAELYNDKQAIYLYSSQISHIKTKHNIQ